MKNNSNNPMSGVYALMLTPYKDDRTIDIEAYKAYTEYQASTGAGFLVPVCGTSEMALQTLDERELLTATAVKYANGVPIFATANLEPSWFAQVEEVKRISATGASGLVFITKGMGDDKERQYTYLCELASFTELPIVLYEYPGCKPHIMEADVYKRLADTGKFVGIKDTTCTLKMIKEKIAVQGGSNILQANVPLLYESYKTGARGVMATTTSCGAQLFQKMWDEFTAGDFEASEKTFQHIILLDCAIDSGFNCSAKYLVGLQGVKMNWINRSAATLGEGRMNALKVFHDWAKSNGLMK